MSEQIDNEIESSVVLVQNTKDKEEITNGDTEVSDSQALTCIVQVPQPVPPSPDLPSSAVLPQPRTPPQSPSSKKKVEICRDFLKGKCYRKACIYKHILPIVEFCHDFQNKKCTRLNCTYIHATLTEQSIYKKTNKLPPHLLNNKEESQSVVAVAASSLTRQPPAPRPPPPVQSPIPKTIQPESTPRNAIPGATPLRLSVPTEPYTLKTPMYEYPPMDPKIPPPLNVQKTEAIPNLYCNKESLDFDKIKCTQPPVNTLQKRSYDKMTWNDVITKTESPTESIGTPVQSLKPFGNYYLSQNETPLDLDGPSKKKVKFSMCDICMKKSESNEKLGRDLNTEKAKLDVMRDQNNKLISELLVLWNSLNGLDLLKYVDYNAKAYTGSNKNVCSNTEMMKLSMSNVNSRSEASSNSVIIKGYIPNEQSNGVIFNQQGQNMSNVLEGSDYQIGIMQMNNQNSHNQATYIHPSNHMQNATPTTIHRITSNQTHLIPQQYSCPAPNIPQSYVNSFSR